MQRNLRLRDFPFRTEPHRHSDESAIAAAHHRSLGSVARGAETAGSDVDLLIVGAASFGAVVEALHPVQQQLSREINPKVFTAREWIAKVVGKPKIFLLGTENDLTELGRHKP